MAAEEPHTLEDVNQTTRSSRGCGCWLTITAAIVLVLVILIFTNGEPKGREGLTCTEQFERINDPWGARFSRAEINRAARNGLTAAECADIWNELGW